MKDNHPLDALNVDDAAVVWRYVDFPKLVHFLEFSSLFFTRLDLLGDPFEGSVTTADLVALKEQWCAMSQESGTPAGLYADDHTVRDADPRHQLFVTCWHMSEFESIAMWRLYAGELKGIAIKSSVGKIRKQLPPDGKIRKVKYLDYGIDKTLHLSPAYCKRESFEYEREVRAVFRSRDLPAPAGISLKVDISTLIDEVRVAPDMPEWMHVLIQQLLVRYAVKVPCTRSTLEGRPQFDWELEND